MITTIACPFCGYFCGSIASSGDERTISIKMKYIEHDVFECKTCMGRFKVSIVFEDIVDVIDVKCTDVNIEFENGAKMLIAKPPKKPIRGLP